MTPARLAKDSPFARNILAGGGIVPCRLAPSYVNDRRSLAAGLAIYAAVGIVMALIVFIAVYVPVKIN